MGAAGVINRKVSVLWKFLNYCISCAENVFAFQNNALNFCRWTLGLQFVLCCICLSFLLTSLQSQLNGRKKTTSDSDWQHISLREGGSMWAHKCIAIMLRYFFASKLFFCDKNVGPHTIRGERNLSSRMFFLVEGCVTSHLNMQLKICGTDTCQRWKAGQKLEGFFFLGAKKWQAIWGANKMNYENPNEYL